MSNIELKGLFIGSEWFGAQERTGEKNFVLTARFLSGDIFQIFVTCYVLSDINPCITAPNEIMSSSFRGANGSQKVVTEDALCYAN
jgi:hypothetical protein